MKLTRKNILLICFVLSAFLVVACVLKSKKTNSLPKKKLEKAYIKSDTLKETAKTISDSVLEKRLLGKFNPKNDSDFILVDKAFCNKEIYLQKEAYESFIKMHKAAKEEGVSLKIISGTRNFYAQKGIWERKWTGKTRLSDGTFASDLKDPKKRALKILLYSSMPSTSRHHWGTDIDINNLNNSYFKSGKGLKEYTWLVKNASKFGFCQVYSDKNSEERTGYEMEKWHWSYLPIAAEYTKKYIELIQYKHIVGFKGAQHAKDIEAIKKYVAGISHSCQ